MHINKECRRKLLDDSMQMAQVIIFDLSLDETSNNFVPNKQMLQPNEF